MNTLLRFNSVNTPVLTNRPKSVHLVFGEVSEDDNGSPVNELPDYNNPLLAWTEIESDAEAPNFGTPTYYNTSKNYSDNAFPPAEPGPNINPAVGYTNAPVSSHTDEDGVLHVIYVDDNSDLLYQFYNGLEWSAVTTVGSVSQRFCYVALASYQGDIFVFYFEDENTPRIWRKSDESTITIPTPPEIANIQSANSSSNPFIIGDDGSFYVGISRGNLIIYTSSGFGEAWSSFSFNTNPPDNNPLLITDPVGITFAKDSEGVIHLVCGRRIDTSPSDSLQIIHLQNTNWESIDTFDEVYLIEQETPTYFGLNYFIDSNDVHHVMFVNEQDSPQFDGYDTHYSTSFDDTIIGNAPDDWVEIPLLEELPTTPETGVTDTVEEDENVDAGPTKKYLNLEWSLEDVSELADGVYTKSGQYIWDIDQPEEIDNLLIKVKQDRDSNGDVSILFSGSAQEDNWVEAEGYILSLNGLFENAGVPNYDISLYKKTSGVNELELLTSEAYGTIPDTTAISIHVEKIDDTKKISVYLGDVSGQAIDFLVPSFTYVDENPLTGIEYGLWWYTKCTVENGLPVFYGGDSGKVYSYEVIDLDSATFVTDDIGDSIWHTKGLNDGQWISANVYELVNGVPDTNEVYAALNIDELIIGFIASNSLYAGTYKDGNWVFSEIRSLPIAGGGSVITGFYTPPEEE